MAVFPADLIDYLFSFQKRLLETRLSGDYPAYVSILLIDACLAYISSMVLCAGRFEGAATGVPVLEAGFIFCSTAILAFAFLIETDFWALYGSCCAKSCRQIQ